MRRTAAAVALSLMLPTGALAAPTKLTHAQLDLISAGVSATIDATAGALGSTALTKTDTLTEALGGRFVSVAFGRGLAFAIGSDDAVTSVGVSGEGGRVRTHTDSVSFKSPKGTVSFSWGLVAAVETNRAPR